MRRVVGAEPYLVSGFLHRLADMSVGCDLTELGLNGASGDPLRHRGVPDHGSPRYRSPARAGPHRPSGPGHSPQPPAVSMTDALGNRGSGAAPDTATASDRSGTAIGEPPRPPDTPATQSGSFGPGHSTRQQPAAPRDGHHGVQARPTLADLRCPGSPPVRDPVPSRRGP